MGSETFPPAPELRHPSGTPDDEKHALVEFLDFYRTVLLRKAEGLTSEELNRTVAASELTLGGLVKHMAAVEDGWFTDRLAGAGDPEPWASAPWEEDQDWEFHSAAGDSPADLRALFDAACARSNEIIEATPSLDSLTLMPAGKPSKSRNLRWILIHMIEEYARHVGHADLLREAIDGQVDD